MDDSAKLVLGAIVGPFVGYFGSKMTRWIDGRGIKSKRQEHLADSAALIAFCETLEKAEQLRTPPTRLDKTQEDVRAELDRTLAELSSTLTRLNAHSAGAHRSNLTDWLLLYRPANAYGWVAHLIFASWFGFFVVVCFLAIAASRVSNWSEVKLWTAGGTVMLAQLVLLNFAARTADGRARANVLTRWLLLYPPASRLGWALHAAFFILVVGLNVYALNAVGDAPPKVYYEIGWSIGMLLAAAALSLAARAVDRHEVSPITS